MSYLPASFTGTPLLDLYTGGNLTDSRHYLVHLSDALRLAYVFKVIRIGQTF